MKSVEKDRNTVMICNAAGDPEPSIVWYKDYVPVDVSHPRLKLLPTGNCVLFNHTCDDDVGDADDLHSGVSSATR